MTDIQYVFCPKKRYRRAVQVCEALCCEECKEYQDYLKKTAKADAVDDGKQ